MKNLIATIVLTMAMTTSALSTSKFEKTAQLNNFKSVLQSTNLQVKFLGCTSPGGIMGATEQTCRDVINDMSSIAIQMLWKMDRTDWPTLTTTSAWTEYFKTFDAITSVLGMTEEEIRTIIDAFHKKYRTD